MIYPEKFPKAIEALFRSVQRHADEEDELLFLEKIESNLCEVCEAVAHILDADSTAVFLVDDDSKPEREQVLVMRGAYGRLKKTYEAKRDGSSYEWFDASSRSDTPGLTHIAWQCGLARWANTRREMEKLRSAQFTGQGDRIAYPGERLDEIFRNCVIVPIFARGRLSKPSSRKDIEGMLIKAAGGDYGKARGCSLSRGEMDNHWRFLQGHRVVGILKAENKRPKLANPKLANPELANPELANKAEEIAPAFRRWLGEDPGKNTCKCCEKSGHCHAKTSIQKYIDEPRSVELGEDYEQNREYYEAERIKDILGHLSNEILGNLSPVDLPDIKIALPNDGHRWDHVCRNVVDFLVKSWNATFSNQDVEVLIAAAMLLGRVLPWRTIQRAATEHIVLDENEVGTLLIQPDDVNDLQSLYHIASQVEEYVLFRLEHLKSELGSQEASRISTIRSRGVVPMHNPIASIESRVKTHASLLQKAVQRDAENAERDSEKGAGVGLLKQRFVPRLLLPDRSRFYDIRDVCGVRITCQYLGDIANIIPALICHTQNWRVKIRKIDNKLSLPDASGYRSVHVDLLVCTAGIVDSGVADELKSALSRVETASSGATTELMANGELWFPCELQIQTAYENSWAKQSHDVYKLDDSDARLPSSLRDFFTIMSNTLFDTDRLSQIVVEQIKEFLAPELASEIRLHAILRERLTDPPNDALPDRPLSVQNWPAGYLLFVMECARELFQNTIRYGGTSQYVHAVSVIHQLIRRFDLLPATTIVGNVDWSRHVTLFAVAMLHDCWLVATNKLGIISKFEQDKYWHGSAVEGVLRLIGDKCPSAMGRFGGAIAPEQLFGTSNDCWAEAILAEYKAYWRSELGDVPIKQRINWPSWTNVIKKYMASKIPEQDRRDVCHLLAALLIERLEELPQTPNVSRRRQRFRDAYKEFRQLRDKLLGTMGATKILTECYRTIQTVATQLGVEIPINWYE